MGKRNRQQRHAVTKKSMTFDGGFRKLCRDTGVRAAYLRVEDIDEESGMAALRSGGDPEIAQNLDEAIKAQAEGRIKPAELGEGMLQRGSGLFAPKT